MFSDRDTEQHQAWAPPRNQIAELPAIAAEMTPVPAARRAGFAREEGDYRQMGMELAQAALSTAGLATLRPPRAPPARVPVWRGHRGGVGGEGAPASDTHRWWYDTPGDANSMAATRSDIGAGPRLATYREGSHVYPGEIDPTGFARVDAAGDVYDNIRTRMIQHPELRRQFSGDLTTTDDIAQAASELGLPGVRFTGLGDIGGKEAVQYYVNDLSRRTSTLSPFPGPAYNPTTYNDWWTWWR